MLLKIMSIDELPPEPVKGPPADPKHPKHPGRPVVSRLPIVQGLADGLNVIEAGKIAGLTESGTRQALTNLRRQCRVRSNCQLVAHYVRNGWID